MNRPPVNGDYWWIRVEDSRLTVARYHSDAQGFGYFLLVGSGERDYATDEVELVAFVEPPPGYDRRYFKTQLSAQA